MSRKCKSDTCGGGQQHFHSAMLCHSAGGSAVREGILRAILYRAALVLLNIT